MDLPYVHEVVVELEAGGDAGALGGAVTVALCGHWDHEPPCRWPHRTEPVDRNGLTVVHVEFAAQAEDEAGVRQRIEDALAAGILAGPEHRITRWTVVGPS
ncbi:MAG: hypothetical protein H0T17_06755 [Propionibacteriales bacterium]|nr:hypothetical protein [Propionibacteriales bacterium]